MSTLKVALIQTYLHWEDPAKNRQMFDKKLQNMSVPVDLIVLPEMFSTGFTMYPESNAENMDGATVGWMKSKAEIYNAAITGSLIIEAQGCYYNRMIWVEPKRDVQYYDKRHLFCYAGEHKRYTAGKERKIVAYKGWNILLNVCYDLRFPVWSRNLGDYDILVNVANWPEARIRHWNCLLQARAIENLSFVLGLNRVGVDGNEINYSGESAIIRFDGEVIQTCTGQEEILLTEIRKEDLLRYKEKMAFHLDADRFDVLM